jgi:acyl-CoA synthetase (NDP forming)
VLLALVPTAVARATGDDLVRALTDAPEHRAKPVITVRLEQELPVKLLPAVGSGTIPSYAEPQAAARALSHAAHRAARLSRPAGTVPQLDEVDTDRAREVTDTYLTAHPDGAQHERCHDRGDSGHDLQRVRRGGGVGDGQAPGRVSGWRA